MNKNHNIEFWNFVCHFGENELKLLDKYIELVHPIFTNKELVRSHGDSRLFFHGCRIIVCNVDGEDQPFVYGRIVKDMTLARQQVFENDELKEDPLSIPSSPSSIFILSLLDHRLFYIKEQRDSPEMDTFKATVKRFMADVRRHIIEDEHSRVKELRQQSPGQQRSVTKKSLGIRYPEANLEIVPLASDAGVEEFVKSLKSIDQVKLELVKPNSECDTNPFFEEIRKKNKLLNSPKATVQFNKHKTTLPHEEVAKLSKEAARDENTFLTIAGRDIQNDKIRGTNDSFSLKQPITEIDDSPTRLTEKVYTTFKKLISNGIIRGPRIDDMKRVKQQIEHIIAMIK